MDTIKELRHHVIQNTGHLCIFIHGELELSKQIEQRLELSIVTGLKLRGEHNDQILFQEV
jgi:hypothetical protein